MKIDAFDYKRGLFEIRGEIDEAIGNVLNSGKLILGLQVEKFENDFAAFVGCKHGIGVNSGTDAIRIALRALNVGIGDEVITVPNTAVPTVSAIRELGAIPKFVDIDDDFNIDVNKIEKVISSKTKVIMPVHLYGKPCNMKEIIKIAKKYKLSVVEDCAQAHGAKIGSKMVGSFGVISCFSFYPTKNLGAYGDGGLIVTSNQKIAEKCRMLRAYGMKKTYYANIEGYNSRLDEMQAAILNVKFKYLNDYNNQRRNNADFYLKNILNNDITLPIIGKLSEHCFHQFVIRVKNRDKFMDYLKTKEIGFGIHYPFPVHIQKAYKFLEYKKFDFPKCMKFSKELVSLPIFPELRVDELEYIVNCLNEYKA